MCEEVKVTDKTGRWYPEGNSVMMIVLLSKEYEEKKANAGSSHVSVILFYEVHNLFALSHREREKENAFSPPYLPPLFPFLSHSFFRRTVITCCMEALCKEMRLRCRGFRRKSYVTTFDSKLFWASQKERGISESVFPWNSKEQSIDVWY